MKFLIWIFVVTLSTSLPINTNKESVEPCTGKSCSIKCKQGKCWSKDKGVVTPLKKRIYDPSLGNMNAPVEDKPIEQ